MSNGFTQVLLFQRKGPKTWVRKLAWVPSSAAKVGKLLKIKDLSAEGAWKVEELYATFPCKHVKKYKEDFHNLFEDVAEDD